MGEDFTILDIVPGCVSGGGMSKCYFAKEAPKVEVRGGMAFIILPSGHCEVAVSAHVLSEFVGNANRALDVMFGGPRNVVHLRACE